MTKTWRIIRATALGAVALLMTAPAFGTAEKLASNALSDHRWTNRSLYGGTVRHIEFHPTDARKVYAGTGGGTFKSVDGGKTWSRLGRHTGAIAVAPSEPSIVYAGRFRSDDGGSTWNPVARIEHSGTRALAVHPENPDFVLLSTLAGTYRSDDGGQSWDRLISNPADEYSYLPSDEIVFAPSDPSIIYSAGLDVLRSEDGGDTWEGAMVGPQDATALDVDPQDPLRVYAGNGYGIWRSVNGGSTWTHVWNAESLDRLDSLAVDPTDRRLIMATSDYNGVLRSTDAGQSWKRYSKNLPANPRFEKLATIAVAPDGSGVSLVGLFQHGLYRRERGQDHWTPKNRGLIGSAIRELDTAPSDNGRIYAAALSQGVFMSQDAGGSWRYAGLRNKRLIDIEVHPNNADKVFAAGEFGMKVTSDGGRNWKAPRSGLPTGWSAAVAISPVEPRLVYLSSESTAYRSTDGGRTWEETRLDTGPYELVRSLEPHPYKANVVYAGGTKYIWKSKDRGRTWRRSEQLPYSTPSPTVEIQIDPRKPTRIFAVSEGTVLRRSTDGGKTWKNLWVTGAPPNPVAMVLDRGRLFVTSWGFVGDNGVYVTKDNGRSWNNLTDNLGSDLPISSVAINRRGTLLHVGSTQLSDGSGVFSRRI